MIELTTDQKKEETEEIIESFGEEIAKDMVSQEDIDRAIEEEEEIRENSIFDLDGALDTYDEKFTKYMKNGISDHAIEFFVEMRLVQGNDFEFATPPAHYFMVDMLLGYITDPLLFPYSDDICKTISLDKLFIGFMESRGLAKSTIVISFFVVYSAIKGKLPNGLGNIYFYLILAASSKGGARVNALAVRAMCEDSKYLKDIFEEMRFTETESEFVRKCPDGKNIPKKNRSFLARYQGINTGVRGSRYGERRPDALIFDDAVLNSAAAYSKVMSDNLEEIIQADATNALKGGGNGRVILCFTPFYYGDVNTKAVINGTFTPVVIPIARSFDVEANPLKIDMIHSSWEGMHPNDSILKMVRRARLGKKLNMFQQERALRLSSGSERLIPDSCIQFCDMKPIVDNIAYYTTVITTDYTSTSGEKADFAGRATWAISNNDDWFLIDLSLRKTGIAEQEADTLNQADLLMRKGKSPIIGVEVDGNQASRVYGLETAMRARGTYYQFAKQKGSTGNRKGILSKASGVAKHERFRLISPRFLENKIWLPEHQKNTPDMIEFLNQIRGITHKAFTKADDGPDLCSQLGLIDYIKPVVDVKSIAKNNGSDYDPIWDDEPEERVDAGSGYC